MRKLRQLARAATAVVLMHTSGCWCEEGPPWPQG